MIRGIVATTAAMPAFRIALALVLLGVAVASAAAPPVPLTPEETTRAESSYQRYCSLCHGRDREGHANDAAPSLKSRSLLESGWPRSIFDAIAYGRPGTPMGGYLVDVGGPLQREDIGLLTRWLGETAGVPPLPLSHDAVAGDARQGARVYAENCASCHGRDGQGGEGTALGNPAMLALNSDAFLRHAIVHGRQDTPMPAFAGTLPDARIDDVVAFLRSRASGWKKPAPVATPPELATMVLNPGRAAPTFELRDGLYVSADELARELKAKKSMVLLDTRVPSVWRLGHIAGAAPLPYYSGAEVLAKLPRDGTWIVAYCECPRAAAESVVTRLRAEGFASTAVLYEGFQGWLAKGHPIVAGATPDGDGAAATHAH
jgi:mono/diheme cytochrome c family protein/rhodanese-related sulfurtransferase